MTDRFRSFRSRGGDIRLLHGSAHHRGDMFAAVVSVRAAAEGAAFRSGCGIASIDGEARAMVRRASQFPTPTTGAAPSCTVSVKFRLN